MKVGDKGTWGEYMPGYKSVVLFNAQTNNVNPVYVREGSTHADNATTLEAGTIHEMAHGIIGPIEIDNWVDTMDYWNSEYNPSGESQAEKPPTEYGHKNPHEDLAESVAIYFVNRPQLEAICPKRAAFITDMIASWTPPVKEKALATAAAAKGGRH